MTADAAGGEMPLADHLAELRTRLIRSILALVAGAVVGYVFFPDILDVLLKPYCNLETAYRDATGECALVATRVLEAFSVRIKASLVVGLVLGAPVIFFQIWRFVTPGLTDREKNLTLPFVVLSQVMFVFGGAFAYLVIPKGLEILLGLGGDRVAPLLSAGEYFSFLLTTIVAFGLVFELPLFLTFLALVGIVSASGLRKFRPYAIVVNTVVAAIVTPTTDPVNLLFMAVPMTLFYELSIMAAWLIERSRRKRDAA